MTMEIATKEHTPTFTVWLPAFLVEVLDELLSVVDSWMQELTGLLPPAVQVNSKQADTVVTVNYTVRIKHGNDFDHEFLPHLLRLGIIREKPVNDTVDHV